MASRTPQPSPQATPQGPPSNLIGAKSDKLLKLSLLWDLISTRPSDEVLPPTRRISMSLPTEAMGNLGIAVVVVEVVVLGGWG